MTYITTDATNGNSIRNETGTDDRSCDCGSWLGHWKIYAKSGISPECSVEGCDELATVGAHVDLYKVQTEKGKSYIAPMCSTHNGKHGAEFRSKPGVRLARAAVDETCG